MTDPLVSVICLCYNQERFVAETLQSVFSQTYKNIELIIVDDASSDGSSAVIGQLIKERPAIQFIPLEKNIGSTSAFNTGLRISKGQYIIDLAADDILLPDRIEKGINAIQKAGDGYGVNFTDAEWIDETGRFLYRHSQRFPHATVPQGDIYQDLIERYFICSPTVMFTRDVITYLHGYDETLLYEDFDFWIRSSRKFLYCYTPEVLVKKRIVRKSQSADQFQILNPYTQTTFKVCEKIMYLNKNSSEQQALSKRIGYEFILSLRLMNLRVAFRFIQLYFRNRKLKYS